RRKAITQSLGLLTMENGAFLLSLTLAGGLPLAIELAIFLEVIVLVVLLGILFYRIRETFDSLDASAMTSLGE
ncbi:MAG TPA: hydrogenase, partial [Candidatus Thermoplasmatota archaeon]|nr:hydrogenase [Candidatus Thermoplasmatota archaeon]